MDDSGRGGKTSGGERRRVLVSGASSGIGRAAAERFAREGWDVCLLARREAQLQALLGQLPSGDHLAIGGDYSDPSTARRAGEAIASRWGRVDALVNSAGVFDGQPCIDSPFDAWQRSFRIMVEGAAHLTRALVPLMVHGGRLVHITSVHGRRGERMASAYSMAKAAIDQYCRSLAVELADRGILANAIAPGFVATPMSVIDGVNELETEWFEQSYIKGHHLPLRRAARPEEIAGVAWFLCGPDASYITGQVLTVDGGLTITF